MKQKPCDSFSCCVMMEKFPKAKKVITTLRGSISGLVLFCLDHWVSRKRHVKFGFYAMHSNDDHQNLLNS